MAKKDKVETKQEKIRYFARYLNFAFDVPVVDAETGKKLEQKTNAGQTKFDNTTGNVLYVTKSIKFKELEVKASKGYKSYFDFDPNDSSLQNIIIGEALEKLDIDEGVNVETEQRFERNENPVAYKEKEKNKELQEALDASTAQLNSPDFLREQLAKLENSKG